MKLSLERFICWTRTLSLAEWSTASGTASPATRPVRGVCATATPRRAKASREGCRGDRRRAVRAREVRAVDDEGGERRRLDAEEVRLPARCIAACVVVALVRDDAAGHSPDTCGLDVACEAADVGEAERRVSVADEIEIAVPLVADELSGSEDLRVEPEARTELLQRGERDRELLGRRGNERPGRVVLEDDLPGPEVDCERAGSATVDVGGGKRLRELGLETGSRRVTRGSSLRAGGTRRADGTDDEEEPERPRSHGQNLGGLAVGDRGYG